MKKIIYILSTLALCFSACTPLEDIYSEMDEKNTSNEIIITGDDVFTLNEEEYKSSEYLALSNEYFETEEQAKELLPNFLSIKYPYWGKGSTAAVTYNLKSDYLVRDSYTLVNDDYDAVKLPYITSMNELDELLKEVNLPRFKNSTVVSVTYDARPNVNAEFFELSKSDYELVGDGKYKNFNMSSNTKKDVLSKLGAIILNRFPSTESGTIYEAFYNTYKAVRKKESMFVKCVTVEPTGSVKYTLTKEDYELVGNGRFNNFDIRSGKPEETIAARVKKINIILKERIVDATQGAIYAAQYKTYNGSSSTDTTIVEFNGTDWTLFNSLDFEMLDVTAIKKTSDLVYKNRKLNLPYVITADDYTAMGQGYGSFDIRKENGKADASRKITTLLSNLFPYDVEGDFRSVEFISYIGGGKNESDKIGFVYINGLWTSNIPETTQIILKFGHDGKFWVPDNTIKYTLTKADFELVGNGKYSNFDVRGGKDDETVEARLVKINKILLNNFPNDKEGQKYLVKYAVYNGSSTEMETKVIKQGDEYILFEE